MTDERKQELLSEFNRLSDLYKGAKDNFVMRGRDAARLVSDLEKERALLLKQRPELVVEGDHAEVRRLDKRLEEISGKLVSAKLEAETLAGGDPRPFYAMLQKKDPPVYARVQAEAAYKTGLELAALILDDAGNVGTAAIEEARDRIVAEITRVRGLLGAAFSLTGRLSDLENALPKALRRSLPDGGAADGFNRLKALVDSVCGELQAACGPKFFTMGGAIRQDYTQRQIRPESPKYNDLSSFFRKYPKASSAEAAGLFHLAEWEIEEIKAELGFTKKAVQ